MGIFDKLTGEKEIVLDSKSAILLGCLTMVAADGDIDDDEIAIIRRIDGNASTRAWETALNALKKKPLMECAALVAQYINPEHVEPLMANLIDIAMADSELMGAEKQLLEHYMELLSPDPSAIDNIVSVIGLKNSVKTI